MRKLNKKFKNLIILIILIILFILLCSSLILTIMYKNSFSNREHPIKEFYPYYYFKNINNAEKFFLNRQTLIINESNTILVGRNKKELQNGYYDLKFEIDKTKLYILVNNLQKEDIEFKCVSDEYLNELKLFLYNLLDYKYIDDVINIIKEEYIKLRNSINCVENNSSYRIINIDKYIVIFSIENNMLKIDIKM